jgi:hypothetical protein
LPPTITIDNTPGTGSDTAASGAGPAAALAGTAAATSASGLVVTLDGAPDLVNVATDGTHALWVATVAGRQYSPITAKDNTAKTVTVSSAYTANLTGQAWGLGGRRATLDHANTRALLAADVLAGWTVDVRETGVDYLLTSNLKMAAGNGTASAPITITSSSVSRPVIRTAVAGMHLLDHNQNRYWQWKHLSFRHAGTTRGHGFRANGNDSAWVAFTDCVFDGFANAVNGDNQALWRFNPLILDNCLIRNCTGDGVINNGVIYALNISALDNAGAALNCNGSGEFVVLGCVLARNARGIYASGSLPGTQVYRGNLLHSHTLSGIEVGVGSTAIVLDLEDNVLWGWGAGGFGIRAVAGPAPLVARRNAYGSPTNPAGARSANLAAGAGDITLTADPCVNAAGNDFRPNTAAGGGVLLKGIARTVGTLAPSSFPDIGPYQSAGGGGGVSRSRAVNGG